MTPTLTSLVLCGLILVLLRPLLRFLYNVSPFHPLSSYPGPFVWRASRLPWVIALQRGTLHQKLLAFHSQYGSVVRIAPDELSYTDSRAWRDIYLPQPPAQVPFERTPLWFVPIRPTDPISIMGADEAAHARYRRAFMPAFTDRALNSQFPLIETNMSNFINQLKRRAVANEPVDIVAWLNFLAFDVSGQLSFGETFGSVDAGVAHPWVAINLGFGRGAAMKAGLNMLELSNGLLGRLLSFIVPKAIREKMQYHRALAGEKVKQKLSAGAHGPRADFLDALVQHNEAAEQAGKDSQALSTPEIEINMGIMIFAGSETVASAVSGILTALLQNHDVLAKLQSEIREAFHHEEEITAANVTNLPYLTATITEGLRMYPPVPYSLPRVVPKGGATICGRPVPEGVSTLLPLPCLPCLPCPQTPNTHPFTNHPAIQTLVAVNQLPAYHSPLNFPSPNHFNPTRWLSPSATANAPIFNPFILGRHTCIGHKFAWAEMRLVLARLLWAFDMDPQVGPAQGEMQTQTQAQPQQQQKQSQIGTQVVEDFLSQRTHLFWEKRPLRVRLVPR